MAGIMRSKWLFGVSLAAIPFQVHAQEGETRSAESSAIGALTGDIVVSATKKKDVENVQDVPLSVTAYNSQTLEALQVRDLESLSMTSPNVSLDQIGTTRGVANFSIRGLGVNSSIPSIDPTVGVFVDGVYLGINNGVVFDTFDLESVEVLRGPQGILFGRNTTGGAVLVNSGNPTDYFTAKFKAIAETPVDRDRGDFNKTVMGSVSGPIVPGMVNFKVAGYYNKDEGYFKNQFTRQNHGEAETSIVRGALEINPDGAFRVMLKGEYFDSQGDGPAGKNHGVFERDNYDFAINGTGTYDAEAWFGMARFDLDVGFGDGVITNIFGYREYKETTLDNDIDSLPVTLFHADSFLDQKQISNELRYAGSFGALDLTVGGYWFQQDIDYQENRVLPTAFPATFIGGGIQDHEVFGLFAQGDYNVTDRLSVIAGIRYSHEKKSADITYVRPRLPCSVLDGTCPTTGVNQLLLGATGGTVMEPNGYSDKNSWENFSPRLGLQYEFGEGGQVYASWTRGYRSGGYNFRVTDVAVFLGQIVPLQGDFFFDEEKVDSFEVGAKWQSSDRRLTVNGAVFLTKVADMQREVNTVNGTTVVQNILNTADAEIFGAELEGRYALTDNLLVSANVGYIDAEYKDIKFDISGSTANLLTGVVDDADYALALPRVPEWTFGASVTHEWEFEDNAQLITRLSFQHRDKVAFTDNNFGWIPAFDDLSGSMTIRFGQDRRFSMTVFGKNLLDDIQFGGDTQTPFGGGAVPAVATDGTVGLPGPRSNLMNVPFDSNPAFGTFSPLSKGRRVGIEFSVEF